MKKQFIISTIIIVFIVSFTFQAMAESCTPNNVTCFDCGENCLMKLTYETNAEGLQIGTLTVSGTGKMRGYYYHEGIDEYGDSYSRPWASLQNKVQNIVIEEGITNVGFNTFISFSNLKNVELADSVTSLEAGAFQSCPKLDNINIGENINFIGSQSLEGTALTSLVIPQNATLTSSAFYLRNSAGKIKTLYCTENKMQECETAIAFKGDEAEVIKYKKRSDGTYIIGGRFYGSFTAIQSGNHIKKRIYTVDEANAVTNSKNTFKIRYK